MVEKNSEKRWMSILIVLMVIVLVVDLLSLNVLYRLNKEFQFDGELAAKKPRDFCEECQKTKDDCLHYCNKKNQIETCYTSCYANYDSCLYSYNCEN